MDNKMNIDYLFTNALVLTMDEQFHQFEPGAVAVQGDSIVQVGLETDLLKMFEPGMTIDCKGKVLMPGRTYDFAERNSR
jgi:5-methylthioadenosine/S-adenosylhomocysteine deaminase